MKKEEEGNDGRHLNAEKMQVVFGDHDRREHVEEKLWHQINTLIALSSPKGTVGVPVILERFLGDVAQESVTLKVLVKKPAHGERLLCQSNHLQD